MNIERIHNIEDSLAKLDLVQHLVGLVENQINGTVETPANAARAKTLQAALELLGDAADKLRAVVTLDDIANDRSCAKCGTSSVLECGCIRK
jgi:hypothetical protein